MNHPHLFTPGRIGRLSVKNRIIMGPMGNINMADPFGRPTQKMIDYFAARARGGAGLIITGLVPVSFAVDPGVWETREATYFPRLDGSARHLLAGWRDLAAGLHAYGARAFVQLTAGLGRVGSPECLLKGKIPLSSSWNRNFYLPLVPHRPVSNRALRKIVDAFAQAAVNAKVSGFDGVQLHGHEGYLLDQMTSPLWNRRRGRYGGNPARRARFALEIVASIKERCGADFPVMYRIDLTHYLRETYGDVEFRRIFGRHAQEREAEETLALVERLVAAGVDAVDIDKGCYDNWWWPHPPVYQPAACMADAAARLKQFFQEKRIDIPVAAVGKLGDPDVAERILAEGQADFILLARPLLADPDWPRKVYRGESEEIRPCIGDQEGCIHSFIMGGHPCCAVNPRTGFEDVKREEPAPRPKKVAVVGGGPAGIEAALAAGRRGHEVILFEAGPVLGGQLIPAAAPPNKVEVGRYLAYLRRQVEASPVPVRLDRRITAAELSGEDYDVIVCATGSTPIRPVLPGIDATHVLDARAWLTDPGLLDPAVRRVVVIGGGVVGCEVALTLAEHGKEVTILEMLPHLMVGTVHANRAMLLYLLKRAGVKALTAARAIEVGPEEVMAEERVDRPDPYLLHTPLVPENIRNPFARRYRPARRLVRLPAGAIVVAAGAKPNDALYLELLARRAAPEIFNVGDSLAPARVWEAVNSGYEVGRVI